MIITWYGHSCFKIQTRPKRGDGEITIFTDPFKKSIGLRPPQGSADIITISHSHSDHNNFEALKGNPFIIDAAGEYSIKGVSIQGIESFHDDQKGAQRGRNTIFVFESEEMRICHLGDLGHKLSEEQLDSVGDLDVLMIPVGGEFTLDAKGAKEVINQLEPGIILPMHYQTKELKLKLADETEFLKLLGVKPNGKENKLVIKKKDVSELENHLTLLNITNS